MYFSGREIRDLSRIAHKSGRYEIFGIVYIIFYKSIFYFDFKPLGSDQELATDAIQKK